MTDTNQKLREALQAFAKRGTGFDSCPTRRLPQSDEAKEVDQWWLRYFMDADLLVRALARQALALPTAAPVDERELPPLPGASFTYERSPGGFSEPERVGAYTADQMRAYARASLQSCADAVKAEREACAALENEPGIYTKHDLAAAIRARGTA